VHAHLRNCQRRELACTLSKPPLGTPRTGKACDLSNTVTSSAGTRISRSAFAGLDQGTTTAPNETQSRKPVNTPDQRKPQYPRKEREQDCRLLVYTRNHNRELRRDGIAPKAPVHHRTAQQDTPRIENQLVVLTPARRRI